MFRLREAVGAWSAAGQRIAAATVVRVAGSTPHQLGLAVVVNQSGDVVGAVSGGCVDGEIALACDRVLAGGAPEVLTFAEASDDLGSVGLVCGGELTVWVHRLGDDAIRVLTGPGVGALVTAADGALSGGMTSAEAEEILVGCSGNDRPGDDRDHHVARWIAGSTVRTEWDGEVFLEAVGRRRTFVIVGASGYTDALCGQAALLGYETVLIEPRPRFAAGITCADEVLGSWPDAALDKLAAAGRIDRDAAIVVCTHDAKFDEPAVEAALRTSAGFIGALGSRRTTADRRQRLLARGIRSRPWNGSRPRSDSSLGGSIPAETAVSIVAQIIASRHGRVPEPLRDTTGPLHAR
ncbi:MAG: XdhC family protein [Candidatus Nanopelagicales bacterium]